MFPLPPCALTFLPSSFSLQRTCLSLQASDETGDCEGLAHGVGERQGGQQGGESGESVAATVQEDVPEHQGRPPVSQKECLFEDMQLEDDSYDDGAEEEEEEDDEAAVESSQSSSHGNGGSPENKVQVQGVKCGWGSVVGDGYSLMAGDGGW